jgi:hypothetical protein
MASKNQRAAVAVMRECSGKQGNSRRTTRNADSRVNYDDSSDSELSEPGSEEGESASDGDVEDEDAEEPEVKAPSRPAKHNRGRQTGLSLSLSKTDIASAAGRKRALSTSSEETITTRPRKLSRGEKKAESDNLSSDDDIYNAVDDISDSDLEERRILRGAETQDIIESEEENDYADFVMDEEMNDSAFAEQFARTDGPMGDLYSSEALNDTSAAADTEETPLRRVRFAGIDSSSSSSTSSDFDAAFPDLLGQELDYTTYQQMDFADDDDDDDDQSSDGYWELDPNNPNAEEDQMLRENGFYDDNGSSGYESGLLMACLMIRC